jgi:hypothetical protein
MTMHADATPDPERSDAPTVSFARDDGPALRLKASKARALTLADGTTTISVTLWRRIRARGGWVAASEVRSGGTRTAAAFAVDTLEEAFDAMEAWRPSMNDAPRDLSASVFELCRAEIERRQMLRIYEIALGDALADWSRAEGHAAASP